MELFDEDVLKTKKKKKGTKGTSILLVFIILLSLICIVIVGLIIHLKGQIIYVTLDGIANDKLKQILIFEEGSSNIKIPVREFAEILGYESYNGEYLRKSEDRKKCYVESENEVVNISLNSNVITKKDLTTNSDYEKVQLEEPINEINGELYTNIDGIEKIFNVQFEYNFEKKNVTVYSLSYLAQSYSSSLSQLGYEEIKEGFSSQKAILNDILIVKNANGKYGSICISTNEVILEPKYDDIEYLKSTNDFLVTSNGLQGIISYDREIKVDIQYEKIEEINQELYRVTKNNNIGVITKSGENVIYPKFDYIGIENNAFDGIESNYILLNDLIPIKEDKKWAIYGIDGKQITDFVYDSLGCIINNDREKKNLLTIDEYDVLIAQKEKKYYIIKKDGTEAIEYGFDLIYKIDNEGKEEYYMTYNNGMKENVIEWLEKLEIRKKEQ